MVEDDRHLDGRIPVLVVDETRVHLQIPEHA